MKAILMLEDGHGFIGESLGIKGEKIGEVIMNTAVVGYQEIMTDPANAGKILMLTYPLIGNYGVAPKFNESKNVWLAGLVIKEKSRIFSNWQAKGSFDGFVKENNLLVLHKIDTRSLAVHLRQKGQMLGIISTSNFEPKELLSRINAFAQKPRLSLLPQISVARPITTNKIKSTGKKIAVLDLGVTKGIIRQLENLGFSITILPYHTKPQAILRLKLKGLVVSGGPEEDVGLDEVVSNLKALIGKLPILGIATGHQTLARALGAKIVKMKLGHRGVNYPINNPVSYKSEITVQNHACVVDADSLIKIKGLKITAYNLNDRTIEEIESKRLKLIGAQYNPASPGFDEVNSIFRRFIKLTI